MYTNLKARAFKNSMMNENGRSGSKLRRIFDRGWNLTFKGVKNGDSRN